MSMLALVLASGVVPPAAVALLLIGLLLSVGFDRWQHARPRFEPIFVRSSRDEGGRRDRRRRGEDR